MKNKIYDCVTFFDENFQLDLRFNILYDYVDKFIICESKFDHRGVFKNLNFRIDQFSNFKDKIDYIILDHQFPNISNPWETQAYQRDYMLKNLKYVNDDDYIFFSDPDEIPDPQILKNFNLEKKYGIFLQKCFNYKFNLHNSYETPWEGTRVCKKKNLNSIDFMRQKIKSKNLKYNFFRFDKEKSIQLYQNAGWHFNNIMEPEQISVKLKTFAHSEFSDNKYSDVEIIRSKINKKIDLYDRGHQYREITFDESFPKYLFSNYELYKNYIL